MVVADCSNYALTRGRQTKPRGAVELTKLTEGQFDQDIPEGREEKLQAWTETIVKALAPWENGSPLQPGFMKQALRDGVLVKYDSLGLLDDD